MTTRVRVVIGLVATAVLVGPLAWFWAGSLVPSTYSVMAMGYADFGGGPVDAAFLREHGSHAAHGQPRVASSGTSVADLTGPPVGTPDVAVTLTARKESFRLGTGQTVDGYTLNHTSPGPAIRVRQGQLLQVTLVNASVPDGVTLHWHGVDVPGGEDGVAGVTQDAVGIGKRFVYRFVVPDAGTYWYHSHQVSHEQVLNGLFGALVVDPAGDAASGVPDALAVVHTYGGLRTSSGAAGETRVDLDAGHSRRIRVVNTDNGPLRLWTTGAPYRVLAIDGHEVNAPTAVSGKVLVLGAGGRADVEVTAPQDGSAVRVELGGGPTYLVVGPAGAPAPAAVRADGAPELDLLSYGSPAPLGFDPASADRRFEYSIGRRIGFLDGRPGMWWTVNGHQFPNVPMFVVSSGDVVRLTIENHSGQVHPMHLHGHHAVVLSRNGTAASGSPWWVDTINVADGETYDLAFVADNPGIWMDHCHNLQHAVEGLVTHLAYTGISEPFHVGGAASNEPE